MENIEERVISITAEQLGVDATESHWNPVFAKIWKPILWIWLSIMAFEEEFGSEISDEDAQSIQTRWRCCWSM